MRLVAPLVPDPRAPIARAHPLPKLGAAFVCMLALFITVDVVTSAIVLVGVCAALPLSGLPPRPLARRLGPLAVAAVGIGAFNTVFAPQPDLANGAAVALRLVGIALAGLVAVATIEPTDLADALTQHTPASPRFVVAALAAWRLAPLFAQRWEVIGLARRARGIEEGRGPFGTLRAGRGRMFALLVGVIRRATSLALAMDARGFGQRDCRTSARPRSIGGADWGVLAAATLLSATATAISIALGTWRPLW